MKLEIRRLPSSIASCLLLAAGITGCSSHVARLTLYSTRNVDLSAQHDRLPRVEQSDRRLWLAFIPLGGEPSGLVAAQEILEDKNADYLTNVEVREGGWTLLAISMGWVEVAADPWRVHSGSPSTSPDKSSK
jgi:hypothetical protein